MIFRYLITLLLSCYCSNLPCQNLSDSVFAPDLQSRYLATVNSRVFIAEKALTASSQKSISRLKKQEQKLYIKLARIDSAAANKLFKDGIAKYDELQTNLKNKAENLTEFSLNRYIPYFDTLINVVRFLKEREGTLKNVTEKLKSVSERIDQFEARLNQLNKIQQYLKERRQYLKQQLTKYGLDKHLKKMSKEIYYAGQLLKDYKEMLKDPKKAEQKALALLREIPAFKKFMQRNSMLASIFRIPADNSTSLPLSLAGLQTRASVQQYIQGSLPINSTNPGQFLTQQLQNANGQMAPLKNQPEFLNFLENLGEAPDFKPNQQKTKSFFKRLEYSANIQFGKPNGLMPTTGDFAIGIGYKINNNGVIGLGSSYKLGLGKNISNIRFSHQGFAVRSYIDWKIKSGFYISGGYEKNSLPDLRNLTLPTRTGPVQANHLQQSGLIGIGQKYPINKKMKGSVQLLFDFLSYKNIPKSQPILMRFGWSF